MMADVSEKSYEFLWWWPMSTQPLSLLDRERISIHCSPGEPVETLAGCEVGVKSWVLMLVKSVWKSVMKGAVCIDGGMSMVVVVMMLKGAPMDMEFMRACDVLMLKSTGEPCSWVPKVVLKSRFCWA